MSTPMSAYWTHINSKCKYRIDNILPSEKSGLVIYYACKYNLNPLIEEENCTNICEPLLCPRILKAIEKYDVACRITESLE